MLRLKRRYNIFKNLNSHNFIIPEHLNLENIGMPSIRTSSHSKNNDEAKFSEKAGMRGQFSSNGEVLINLI